MGESARRRHKTDPPPLSAHQIRFCQLYAEAGNATRSYIDAGLPHANNNDAGVRAFHLLRNPKIRRYVRQIQGDAAEAAGASAEYIARGFKRAVDADVTRLFGPDGEMLPPSQWPEDIRLCITRVEVEELTERVDDPDRPGRKKKVAVGAKWKVWLENKTECRKVLAQWRRMLAPDKGPKDDADEDGRRVDVEQVTRALALLNSARGRPPGGDAVGAEPGAAERRVPE